MSLMRGIQSAVFHYLSCAPCTQATNRKKIRRAAKRDRAEREILEAEHPDLYRHPHPNDTNEHWHEEIALGPGPPPRRTRGKKSREGSRREHAPSRAGTQGSITSHGGSSLDVPNKTNNTGERKSAETLDGDNWNRKRYQREDEELWGFGEPDDIEPRRSNHGGSVATRVSRPGTAFSSTDSYFGRAPPVNDLHPPVVSIPSSNARDNKWMLQPPPKAKVMNGKVRANSRSRSGSGGSGASSKVELSLQRQVSEKRLFAKMQRGETPEMLTWSRGSSFRAPSRGQTYDMNTARTNTSNVSTLQNSTKKIRRPKTDSPMLTTNHAGSSSETMAQALAGDTSPHSNRPASSSGFIRISTSSQRPSITVTETESSSNIDPKSVPLNENQVRLRTLRHVQTNSSDSRVPGMRRRLPLFLSDFSLNVFQDRFTPSANAQKYISSSEEKLPQLLPPVHLKSTKVARVNSPYEENIFRNVEWGGSGFGVSREWMGEIQDTRNRWSMDI